MPRKFSGDSDALDAEKFIRSHEKIPRLLRLDDSKKPGLEDFSFLGDTDTLWTNLIATQGRAANIKILQAIVQLEVLSALSNDRQKVKFMHIRQRLKESMIQYMGRF
ncbi:hypothetical protein Syun_001118 [Stephania yunnanensis]|uniref:Uncharacterized protein n=1 Tax=Stephania yunnanensis TaxID=152371 RepID=A0AAP0LE97_9MAGN